MRLRRTARSSFTPAVPGASPPKGRLVVSPSSDGAVTLDVENLYGSLQVAKTLSGDPEAIAELEDFEFTVNWTSDQPDVVGDATSGSFTVTGDGTPAPGPRPRLPDGHDRHPHRDDADRPSAGRGVDRPAVDSGSPTCP